MENVPASAPSKSRKNAKNAVTHEQECLNPADRALSREMQSWYGLSGTNYAAHELDAMDCQYVETRARDTLYIPRNFCMLQRRRRASRPCTSPLGCRRKAVAGRISHCNQSSPSCALGFVTIRLLTSSMMQSMRCRIRREASTCMQIDTSGIELSPFGSVLLSAHMKTIACR